MAECVNKKNKGGNRKYVWFVSFWDEKLWAGWQTDKKIPYFFKFFFGDN